MVSTGLSALLQMEGAEVLVVSRGREASDAVQRFEPDVVVLDVGLPDISGTEVFEQIRRHSPHLPVIFSTGHASVIDKHVASSNGSTAHLLKPYEISTLIAAIRKLVR